MFKVNSNFEQVNADWELNEAKSLENVFSSLQFHLTLEIANHIC